MSDVSESTRNLSSARCQDFLRDYVSHDLHAGPTGRVIAVAALLQHHELERIGDELERIANALESGGGI